MLRTFLRQLYGAATPLDGPLTVWNGTTKGSVHTVDPEYAAKTAELWSANGQDAYFGVGLRRKPLQPNKRGGKRDVGYLPGLFLDLDIGAAGHKTQIPCPPDVPSALSLLAAVPFMPTTLVLSGGGLHAYYLFDALLALPPGQLAIQEYEDLNETLQRLVILAAAGHGWHVDNASTADRVLRLPGTNNYKLAGQPRPVTILDDTGPRLSYAAMLQALRGSAAKISTAAVAAGTPVPASSVTAPAATAASGQPPLAISEVVTRLQALRNPTMKAMFTKVLAGTSFADSERDKAMQAAASVVAWIAPDNAVGPLVDLFKASLGVWSAEPAAAKTLDQELEKLTEKLTRAQEDSRAERERVAIEDAGIKALFSQAPAGSIPGDVGAVGADPFTDQELDDLCVEIQCSRPELPKRWIVQRASSFYLLTHLAVRNPADIARYSQPFIAAELRKGHLEEYLARAPITWWRTGAKGQVVDKTVGELLNEYCSGAEETRASLVLQRGYFDGLNRVFYEAVCPLRPIAPVFSMEVDGWLQSLGGQEYGKLLDWLATVTELERPTCALYLSGPKGTGKSLLAQGVSRLWNDGAPTELGRILDNFNDDLSNCPLILADEALPQNYQGKQTSAKLRELLGSNRRTLSRKHIANATLEGAVRLIMTANNERLLAFSEDMSPDDIAAIAERFLHIDTTTANGYLESRGGNAYTNGWVDRDIIAAHCLWLKENRQVVRGGRFLVEGHTSRVHQSIATRGTLQGLVTEWLVKHLDSPSGGIPKGEPIQAGGGMFLVNTQVVSKYWDQYVRSDRTPDTGRIGRVLKGLAAREERRLNGVRVHEINLEAISRWAEENQVGEPERMMARVNGPVDVDNVVTGVTQIHPATMADLNDIFKKGGQS